MSLAGQSKSCVGGQTNGEAAVCCLGGPPERVSEVLGEEGCDFIPSTIVLSSSHIVRYCRMGRACHCMYAGGGNTYIHLTFDLCDYKCLEHLSQLC